MTKYLMLLALVATFAITPVMACDGEDDGGSTSSSSTDSESSSSQGSGE
jgi:hypothetical protein